MTADEALLLRLRIEALQADYAHAIDEDRLEDWPHLFTERGSYRVITRENFEQGLPICLIYCSGQGMLMDRIVAMRTANIFEPHVYCHTIGALKMLETGERDYRCQSTFQVVRTMADGAMTLFASGRYIDRIVEDGGRLRFMERTVVLDSKRIDTLLVIPL